MMAITVSGFIVLPMMLVVFQLEDSLEGVTGFNDVGVIGIGYINLPLGIFFLKVILTKRMLIVLVIYFQ